MSQLTMEQIDKSLAENSNIKPIVLHIAGGSINVKTILKESEKKTFVARVVENSFINGIEYSSTNMRNTFVATFAQMFLTDDSKEYLSLPMPSKINESHIIDIDKLRLIVDGYGVIKAAKNESELFSETLNEIEMDIKEELDFKNQKILALYAYNNQNNEAVETVSYLANKTLDGVNKICDILDNVKDLTQDGKILKVIPKKKLDQIFGWIQKIIVGIVNTTKKNDEFDSKIINSKITSEEENS